MRQADTAQPGPNIEFFRLFIFYGLIAAIFGFFAFRLFSLQIIEGNDLLQRAEDNRTNEISIQTQRGIIYDRNGYVLARNAASYNVVITPALLPAYADDVFYTYHPNPDAYSLDGVDMAQVGAVMKIYHELSELIDVPETAGDIEDEEAILTFKPCDNDFGIAEVVYIGETQAPFRAIQIACNVDRELALKIKAKATDWPGVGVEVEPIREYPTGSLTSEIIGFLGPIPASREEELREQGFVPNRDKVGYAGIEAWLDDMLVGKNGLRVVEVDNAGQEIRDIEPPIDPVPGYNVELTIDTRLQAAAKASLFNMMDGWNRWYNDPTKSMDSGVVIAMNPKTGEILALVSYPTFENNRMARLIPAYYYEQLTSDPWKPLFNHAISAEHPPGSVFKMAAAVGILNEGVVTPEYEVEDPGKITIEQRYSEHEIGQALTQDYVCWINRTGGKHGMVNFLEGVAWSCDVYWYKVGGGYQDEVEGLGLGIWRLGEYARAIGYGTLTGIELPGEADGLIPDPDWKRITQGENWSTGDTYIATMGQGYILSTPLQVLVSVATLANDGKYMQPTLIHRVTDSEGNIIQDFEPKLKWDITTQPLIHEYDENFVQTGEMKTVEPWVIEKSKEGMRMVTLEGGTAADQFQNLEGYTAAGKTGTAEYCDDRANAQNRCKFGLWPAHAWYVGYAPYDDPEIAVVAFVYNGNEGATVAAPVVREVMDTYFSLKAEDTGTP